MPVTPSDLAVMQRAIDASRAALAEGNMPYGAVLVAPDGQVLHTAGNRQVTDRDPTAHAEMVLVREASARFGTAALRGTTVHASGEPCAMCTGALFWAGVRRIVYAASTDVMAELLGGDLLPVRCAQVLSGSSPPVEVEGPVLAEEAIAVLREAAKKG